MRWGAFAAGLIVGAALSALVIAGALAQRRRTRRTLPWSRRRSPRSVSALHPPHAGAGTFGSYAESAAARAARTGPEDAGIDAELDEELAQTFPASDPLPYSHLID